MPITFDQIQEQYRSAIMNSARQHGIEDIRVFGSVARAENTGNSDVDILVNIAPGYSLLDFVAFKQDIEKLLQHEVDVLTENGLHWYVKPYILAEARPL